MTLTDAGRETLAIVNDARRSVFRDVTNGWPPEDVRRLAELLERLDKRFDELERQV